MHRSYYTVPPTWPPLSPTPHPVCSQPHQVSRLEASEVTASVLYSSAMLVITCTTNLSITVVISQSHEEWLHETSFSLPKTLPLGQTQLCLLSCMHFRIPLAWCIPRVHDDVIFKKWCHHALLIVHTHVTSRGQHMHCAQVLECVQLGEVYMHGLGSD